MTPLFSLTARLFPALRGANCTRATRSARLTASRGCVRRNLDSSILAGSRTRKREGRMCGGLGRLPGFRRTAGDYFHVVLRFVRQLALLEKPVLDSPRTRIVGSGREPDVTELLDQVA